MLKICNITFEYIKNTRVLNNLNGEYNKGLNIVLANRGEGKTTLLNLLLFPKKNQTNITLFGMPITKKISKKEISAIQADWFLNENKTAVENFENSKYDNLLMDKFLFDVGFECMKSQAVKNLSSSDQFKIAILRALRKKPSIIVFDNPFEGVNRNFCELLQTAEDLLENYQKIENKPICAILLSRPFNAENRTISILHGGAIIAKDSYQNIQNKPKTTLVAVNFSKYKNNVFSKETQNYYVDGDMVELGGEYVGLVEQTSDTTTTIEFESAQLETKCFKGYKVGDSISVSIKKEGVILLDKQNSK